MRYDTVAKIGTINELTGVGYEILIDEPTRSIILARFYDGNFIRCTPCSASTFTDPTLTVTESDVA